MHRDQTNENIITIRKLTYTQTNETILVSIGVMEPMKIYEENCTLFSKNTAYAALVVSWPSKKRGNSTCFTSVETTVFDDKSDEVASTDGP